MDSDFRQVAFLGVRPVSRQHSLLTYLLHYEKFKQLLMEKVKQGNQHTLIRLVSIPAKVQLILQLFIFALTVCT